MTAQRRNKNSEQGKINVWGARVHNLKNIDVEIPHYRLTVITGLSGSGKSSLLEMIRGGFYLREGRLRLNLKAESYKAIRSVEFDNAYSTTETQYYHQQRWQAFEREASPLAGELLGIADADADGDDGGELSRDGCVAERTGRDGGGAERIGRDEGDAERAGWDGGDAERIKGNGRIAERAGCDGCGAERAAADVRNHGKEGIAAAESQAAGHKSAGTQSIDSQLNTQINPIPGRGSYFQEITDSQADCRQPSRPISDTADDKYRWQQRLLDVLNIRPLLERAIITLSSGELRRFSLAKALMDKPEVLILESPFVGLDPPTRQMLCELLESVLAMGVSIVMTLTDIARIPDVVTHVYMIKDGRLSDVGKRTSGANPPQAEIRSVLETGSEQHPGHIGGLSEAFLPRSGRGPQSESTERDFDGRCEFREEPPACPVPADTATDTTSILNNDVPHPAQGISAGSGEFHSDAQALFAQAQEFFGDAQAFDTVVEMRNINIAYGQRQIFKDLNWTVHSGEKWNVTGSNGSGKSTLLSLVNADNPKAYSLDISLFDRRRGTGESIWDIKRHIGYLSSEMHSSFRENITVLDLLRGGLARPYGSASASGSGDYLQGWLRLSGCGTAQPGSSHHQGILLPQEQNADFRDSLHRRDSRRSDPHPAAVNATEAYRGSFQTAKKRMSRALKM